MFVRRRALNFEAEKGVKMFSQSNDNNCIIKKTSLPCVSREVVSELSLPDYLPDVSRLLRTCASVGAENSYIDGGNIMYDGEIDLMIIYATSDGRIKSVPLLSEFDGAIELGDIGGDIETELSVEIESVVCRLQNPRRLTVKTKICVGADVYENICATPRLSGKLSAEDETKIQRKYVNTATVSRIHVSDENVPISEDIEIDQSAPAIDEIISVNLSPYIYEVRPKDGKISYRGDITAEIIYLARSEEGDAPRYVSFRKLIPIMGEVGAEGVTDMCQGVGFATVGAPEFRPQTNAFGENRTVEIDLSYTAHLFALCNANVSAVLDMYSVDYQSQNDMAKVENMSLYRASSFNFTADGVSSIDDKDFDSVVAQTANAAVEKTERNGTKMSFFGTVDVSVILSNGAGAYIGRSFAFPFKAETECGKARGDIECTASASVIGVSAFVSGGELHGEAEIGISFIACEKTEMDIVEKCTIIKDRPQKHAGASSMVICYPADGDDVWSISKRYSLSPDELRAANMITGDDVCGKVIIIPREEKRKPIF